MAKINRCFIIMPISTPENMNSKYSGDKDHFIHVLEHLLIPSIRKADLEPVHPITKGSELIHGEIIKNIESVDLVLCDMSTLNPNVFFELGIRTSLNKPVCLIKDDITNNIPFDTAIINNYTYLSALTPWTMEEQIDDLTNHIRESFERCNGSNSLWKYFSLSSPAEPVEGEQGIEGRIDYLTNQIEALREQLSVSSKVPSINKTSATEINVMLEIIKELLSSKGISLTKHIVSFSKVMIWVSGDIDKKTLDTIYSLVTSTGFK
jgi:hypothetical protein